MKRFFWMLIVVLWVLIFVLGLSMFQRKQDAVVPLVTAYDWEAILDNDFVCVDVMEVDTVVAYPLIGKLMEDISDGLFQEVSIKKEESLLVSLRVVGTGKYYEEFVEAYPDMKLLFPLLEKMMITIVCDPVFDDTFSLQVSDVRFAGFTIPSSFYDVFAILEKEGNRIMDGVDPFVVYAYSWDENGLYWRVLVPRVIERNSVAVFF